MYSWPAALFNIRCRSTAEQSHANHWLTRNLKLALPSIGSYSLVSRTFRLSTTVLAGVAVLSVAAANAQAVTVPSSGHPVAKLSAPAAGSTPAAAGDLAVSGWGIRAVITWTSARVATRSAGVR